MQQCLHTLNYGQSKTLNYRLSKAVALVPVWFQVGLVPSPCITLQKTQQAGNHPSPLAEGMPVYKPGRWKADPGLRSERSDLGLAYRGSPQVNPLPHTRQSLPPGCKQGVIQRTQGAGQAAMRKGLGRGAFICGVRRSLDSSTSVEGLLVAGLPPCVPVWGLQLGWRGWGGADLQLMRQAHHEHRVQAASCRDWMVQGPGQAVGCSSCHWFFVGQIAKCS